MSYRISNKEIEIVEGDLLLLMMYILAFCKDRAPQKLSVIKKTQNDVRKYLLHRGLIEKC